MFFSVAIVMLFSALIYDQFMGLKLELVIIDDHRQCVKIINNNIYNKTTKKLGSSGVKYQYYLTGGGRWQ